MGEGQTNLLMVLWKLGRCSECARLARMDDNLMCLKGQGRARRHSESRGVLLICGADSKIVQVVVKGDKTP